MSHPRIVDIDSPYYLAGTDMANRVLDSGGNILAGEWVKFADVAAKLHHLEENVTAYHFARGFGDTMREFVEGQS
jgi:hypothetical protein